MIKDIFIFNNGNVAVLNEKGEQIMKYQELLSDKRINWHIQELKGEK